MRGRQGSGWRRWPTSQPRHHRPSSAFGGEPHSRASDAEDALHIGTAAAQGTEYLLTRNFKHINNARYKSAIIETVERMELVFPVICSPEELGEQP